jgi:hypothetical protein
LAGGGIQQPPGWIQAEDRLQLGVQFRVAGLEADRTHEEGFGGDGEELLGAGEGVRVEDGRPTAPPSAALEATLGIQHLLPIAIAVG